MLAAADSPFSDIAASNRSARSNNEQIVEKMAGYF